ncbi:MAG: glycosyltransferase family A protein, partial [Thermodesulfobacteriota bacterium]
MSDEARPRATVVVPASSGDPALGAVVASCLAQSEPRLEVLVVHDGPSAVPRELDGIDDARVVALALPGLGAGARANVGIALARGASVKILLGGDAEMPPGCIEQELAALDAHPDCAAVVALAAERPSLLAELLEGRAPRVAAASFRADALRSLGGLDAALTHALGYDLWLRLAPRHPVHALAAATSAATGGPEGPGDGGVASRVEHGCVLVRAICEHGLDWWCGATSCDARAAWTELALRLLRSGFPEVLPLVRMSGRRARAMGHALPPLEELERLAAERTALPTSLP